MAGQPPNRVAAGDASVLIGLASIGQLHLLEQLFHRIYVPEAVWQEVVVQGRGRPGAEEVTAFEGSLIERRGVQSRQRVDALLRSVDLGEAETVALAEELSCPLVLIDQTHARRIAIQAGLQCRGVLGLLAEARREGLVPALRPLLEALQAGGFRLDPRLTEQALREAGET